MLYAAAAVVNQDCLQASGHSVACLQRSLNFSWGYVIKQHVVCRFYHLLVTFYFSDCAWTVNSVFHWAARGEGVVAAFPGSPALQLRYQQQTMSLLHALAFPSIKRVATYKELFCGRSVGGKTPSEALLITFDPESSSAGDGVADEWMPSVCGCSSWPLGVWNGRTWGYSFHLPILVQIPSCRIDGAASLHKNQK